MNVHKRTIQFLEEFLETLEPRNPNQPRWAGEGIRLRAEDLIKIHKKEYEKSKSSNK